MVKLKFIRLVYFIISFISLNIVFPTTITVRNGIHFINFGFF